MLKNFKFEWGGQWRQKQMINDQINNHNNHPGARMLYCNGKFLGVIWFKFWPIKC